MSQLSVLDWSIIIGYIVISLAAGLLIARRFKGAKSIIGYFVANRSLPWWLAGISMIASSFAIDTPLGITGMVASHGIQGVWFAWAFIIGGTGALSAFFFAFMLRRSEVITSAELIELRYSGKGAAFLRLFKAIFIGIVANALTLGWVMKAVTTFGEVGFGYNPMLILAVILAITLVYTTVSGMWGIVATDVLQYAISLFGVIALAVYAIKYVGGIDGLVEGINARYGLEEGTKRLNFIPRIDSSFFHMFIVFVTLKWWADPPNAILQRIVSSKNEKHASLATLIFSIGQFAINYWPMILVALVSLIVYPNLPKSEAEKGYVLLIFKLLPSGMLGIVLAAMIAALMSTIDTHINMGASYIVNDIYKRFINPEGDEKHYVLVSRIATVLMLLIAVVIAMNLDSVKSAWYWLSMLLAGYGFVTVIRWFWWRLNAWSEIVCMLTSFLGTILAKYVFNFSTFGWRFIFVVVFSLSLTVIATFLTKPSSKEVLLNFCKLVRPFPTFWGPIVKENPDLGWNPFFGKTLSMWLMGVVMIFSICFGTGHLVFTNYLYAIILYGIASFFGIIIYKMWPETLE
ncbi:MAG: sodium:solute symporter family protein [Pseudomonadota bacterium]